MKETIEIRSKITPHSRIVRRAAALAGIEVVLDNAPHLYLHPRAWRAAVEADNALEATEKRTAARVAVEEARQKEARRNRMARESEEFNREMARRRKANEANYLAAKSDRLDGLKERDTAPVPEGYVVLPLKAITKEGDKYFSTLRREWVCLSNSVGRRVENCDRGRILRKNPFLEAGTPESITKTSFAKVTPKDMCERIPCVVRLFTEPAYGFKDTRHVQFDVINRKHEEDFHGDFLLPHRVSVFELTDLALKYSSVSPRGLKRFLARWIEVESSK